MAGRADWSDHGIAALGRPFVVVETRQGAERMWWITFDEPQRDADGEGP
jgi:hypothetical protein